MRYKGIIIDLDDTIYDYKKAHAAAYDELIQHSEKTLGKSRCEIESAFQRGRKKTHIELDGRASSHNRLLYIQKMLETLEVNPTNHSLELYEKYWGTFLNNIETYDGMKELLESANQKGIKVCILTDLTAHIQFRKIDRLEINKYVDYLVTSEEVGVEKPNPNMFYKALDKLGLRKDEVVMIGDSYKKDILGASNLGIDSIWINHGDEDREIPQKATEIKDTIMIMEAISCES